MSIYQILSWCRLRILLISCICPRTLRRSSWGGVRMLYLSSQRRSQRVRVETYLMVTPGTMGIRAKPLIPELPLSHYICYV